PGEIEAVLAHVLHRLTHVEALHHQLAQRVERSLRVEPPLGLGRIPAAVTNDLHLCPYTTPRSEMVLLSLFDKCRPSRISSIAAAMRGAESPPASLSAAARKPPILSMPSTNSLGGVMSVTSTIQPLLNASMIGLYAAMSPATESNTILVARLI